MQGKYFNVNPLQVIEVPRSTSPVIVESLKIGLALFALLPTDKARRRQIFFSKRSKARQIFLHWAQQIKVKLQL